VRVGPHRRNRNCVWAQRGPEGKEQFEGASLWCHHLTNIFNYKERWRENTLKYAYVYPAHTRVGCALLTFNMFIVAEQQAHHPPAFNIPHPTFYILISVKAELINRERGVQVWVRVRVCLCG